MAGELPQTAINIDKENALRDKLMQSVLGALAFPLP